MHHPLRPDHPASEGLPDGLVAETDAQDGDLFVEAPDDVEGDARLIRGAGAGGQDNGLRCHGLDLLQGRLVVPPDNHVFSELAQVLDQVVGKRVVIIDHQDLFCTSIQ